MASIPASRKGLVAGAALLAIACVTGIVPILAGNILYPDNGGFTRNVLFIRPSLASEDPGYFVIVDEFEPGKPIELVFHSYGALSILPGGNGVQFNQAGVTMQLRFTGAGVTITPHVNKVYSYANVDTVEYVKVSPVGTAARRLVTVMTFGNGSIPHPNIVTNNLTTQLAFSVGESDRFLFPAVGDPAPREMSDGNATITGNYCGYRVNTTGDLQWIVFDDATIASFDGLVIHSGFQTSGFYNATAGLFTPAGQGQGSPAADVPSTPVNLASISPQHPHLLFDSDELEGLREKCDGTTPGPWKAWYDSLPGGSVLVNAFKGIINEDPFLIDSAVEAMLDIDGLSLEGQTWDTAQFITRSTYLYPYLFAYDMVYSNLSAENRSIIEQKFTTKLLALADAAASGAVPTNNHIVVGSVALGIGGLLLKNSTWVHLAQAANDFYLANRVRPNGPCYEGDIYGRYTFENAIKFYMALKHCGGYDYFTNPKFLAFLNYTVSSVTPLGYTPVFEDCGANLDLGVMASIAAFPVNATNPALASNLRWYYPFCLGGEDAGADVFRLLAYEGAIMPNEPTVGLNGGFAYFDSGIACIRGGWERDATYLVISNKHFPQSHVHLDENSIEVYALGKKFLTNPGYPHWGHPGHDYTISTEASNTALIDGQGQLDVTSDGFSAALQNGAVDYIESPSRKAYKSPYSPASNPAFIVVVIAAVACIAIASTIFIIDARQARDRGGKSGLAPAQEHQQAPSCSLFSRLFRFDVQTLDRLDFRSRTISSLPPLLLALCLSSGLVYFVIGLVDYALENVHYLNLSASLVSQIDVIGPLVKGLAFVIVPLVAWLSSAFVSGCHSLLFRVRASSLGVGWKEARGAAGKAWLLQWPVVAFAAAWVAMYLLPRFLDALYLAQVDAGNNISIGILLAALLADLIPWLLAIAAASILLHVVAMRVMEPVGRRAGLPGIDLKRAYMGTLLVVAGLLLAIAVAGMLAGFTAFSGISIENNPLQ